ncbi:MAG: DUF11 domain-containing protein [Chloroflexota bacterium]
MVRSVPPPPFVAPSRSRRRDWLAPVALATLAIAVPSGIAAAASDSSSVPQVAVRVSGPDSAQEGVLYPMTVTVTNTSGAAVPASGLFALIPAGAAARIKDVAGATCRIDRNIQATCQGGALPDGASASIVVDIVPQAVGDLALTGWASVQIGDFVGSGAATIHVAVGPAPTDLGLSGSASTGSPTAGATFTTRYSVRNAGPVAAVATTLEQRLPAGFTFAGGSASNGGTCAPAGSTVTCGLGTVANGEQVAISIDLVAPASPGTASIAATVSASVPDAKAGNNGTSISIKVK